MPDTPEHIARRIVEGDTRAMARLLRDIDDGAPSSRDVLGALHPHTGKAHIVGVTGVPGAGKSTLIDSLTVRLRNEGLTVGILAVDPTSPFSGGALLGDRVRMRRHFLDPGVFIRSMATRGHFGGLTRSTDDMVRVLDASGKDVILIETVGVGQGEVEVSDCAHTTVVVLVPGTGDGIQAIKAGIIEIADIFVLNKADRGDSKRTMREIEAFLDRCRGISREGCWRPVVIPAVATRGEGVAELLRALGEHRAHLMADGGKVLKESERRRTRARLMDALKEEALQAAFRRLKARDVTMETLVERVMARDADVSSLAREVFEDRQPGARPPVE